MKKLVFLVVLALLVAALPSVALADSPPCEGGQPLYAGQNQLAGWVCVAQVDSKLTITYRAARGWCLGTTHLHVAAELSGIPQANGNPIPGRFSYSREGCAGPRVTYRDIPYAGGAVFVAAHAEVYRSGCTRCGPCQCSGPSETAWAGTEPFPGRNWATYFVYGRQ